MDPNTLSQIIALLSKLGGDAKESFLWYLGYDVAITLLEIFGWLATVWLIFSGIKSIIRMVNKDCRDMEKARSLARCDRSDLGDYLACLVKEDNEKRK